MNTIIKCASTAVLLSVTTMMCAWAAPAPAQTSAWKGTNISLGYDASTGNTQDMNLNSAFNLSYDHNNWKNVLKATANYTETKKQVSKRKYYLQNQVDYAFDVPRTNYIFLNGQSTVDSFSPYTYQIMGSVGYGHDLVKNDKVLWLVQFGPGARRSEVAATKAKLDDSLVTSLSSITWQLSKTLSLTQAVTATFSHDYNYYQSQSSLTTNLIDNLALQISYMWQNYTQIPEDSKNTEKTDTETTVSLMYTLA